MKNDQYSQKSIFFMISLRKFLESQNIHKIDDFLSKFIFYNSGKITESQFMKFSQSQQNISIVKIMDIFRQLKDSDNEIKIQNFIKVYQNLFTQPDEQKLEKYYEQLQRMKQLQEKQRTDNIIRLGFNELKNYLDQNQPIQLFDECDQQSENKLTYQQFHSLLIRTGIKEFEDKQFRKVICDKLFQKYFVKQISKEAYIKRFRIPIEKIKIQNKEQELKILAIGDLKSLQITKPQQEIINNQLKIPEENDGFKKLKETLSNQQLQKNQLLKSIRSAVNLFPNASIYFQNGIPSSQQIQFLIELQNLLTRKLIYQDKNKPYTHKGKYYQGKTFFNENNYKLFQMAQSVIQRAKSRIGLARQIQPKDIIQGSLGNCYFLSSIASLISIYPQIVSEKFLFKQNPANYFVIKLFIDGQWQYFATDDHFPSENGKIPIFSKPHGNQVWVMLLEKCWAKCYQSYETIIGGNANEGFAALTGAPTEYFKSKYLKKQQLQIKLKEAFQRKYVITVSGSQQLKNLSKQAKQSLGLMSGHSYSLLKLLNIDGEKLVKLRNPWGQTIWKGEWSFKCQKWTRLLRELYNYHFDPQDGSFYMTMDDFLRYFGSFEICKLNPSYVNSSIKLKLDKNIQQFIQFKVHKSGRYTLTLYQPNWRKMKKYYKNYEYSPARIILMKSKNTWEYIESVQNLKKYDLSIQAQLEQGCEYMINVTVDWILWQMHEACLSVYGPQKIKFKCIQPSLIKEQFQNHMIESFFCKKRGKIVLYDDNNMLGICSQYLFDIQKGIGYYFITNPSQKYFQLIYDIIVGTGITLINTKEKLPFIFNLSENAKYLKGFWVNGLGYTYKSNLNSYTKSVLS